MTTKKHFILFALSITTLMFNACGRQSTQQAKSPTYDIGVVINGVRWATSNVDAPGTFAENPWDAGMFFQWNRKVGWSSTTPMRNSDGNRNWDGSIPAGTAWYAGNDPCPPGWRVPTEIELQKLVAVGYIWANQNGANGLLFGTAPNQIFLPVAGWRTNLDGTLAEINTGYYWSSEQFSNSSAFGLGFYSDFPAGTLNWNRAFGFNVRCVAEI